MPACLKHNKLVGFSACAVAKAPGRFGVKIGGDDRLLKGQGITITKSRLTVQLDFGRNRASWECHGKPAELAEAQFVGLRSAAA